MGKIIAMVLSSFFVISTAAAEGFNLKAIEGDGPEPTMKTTLKVTGIEKDGDVRPLLKTDFVLTLYGGKPIVLSNSRISISSQTESEYITEWFSFDEKTQSFTLKSAKRKTLVQYVQKNGDTTMTVSVSSANYADTYGFDLKLRAQK